MIHLLANDDFPFGISVNLEVKYFNKGNKEQADKDPNYHASLNTK